MRIYKENKKWDENFKHTSIQGSSFGSNFFLHFPV